MGERLRYQSGSGHRTSFRIVGRRVRQTSLDARRLLVDLWRTLQAGLSCRVFRTDPTPGKQPLLGPLVGSIGGCLAYDMLIFNGPGSYVAQSLSTFPRLARASETNKTDMFRPCDSPVNWSAHELLASVKLPQMYRFAKHAAHPRTRHAQARAERDLEATLPPKVSVIRRAELTGRDRPGRRGSTERKDLEVVQRWRVGRERIEKQQEENRDKYVVARKRRVEQAKQEVKAKSDAIQDAFAAEIDNEEAMDTFAVRGKEDWAGREEEGKKE